MNDQGMFEVNQKERSVLQSTIRPVLEALSERVSMQERLKAEMQSVLEAVSVQAKLQSDIKPTLDQISNVLSEMNRWPTQVKQARQNTNRTKLVIRQSQPIRIPNEDAESHSIPIQVEGVSHVLRVSRRICILNTDVDFER